MMKKAQIVPKMSLSLQVSSTMMRNGELLSGRKDIETEKI